MTTFFRNLILGDSISSSEYAVYKRSQLVATLCFISLCIGLFYLIASFLIVDRLSWKYIAVIVVALICIALNRQGKSTLAMSIQLIKGNIAIFYFACIAPNQLGVNLLFISCSLGAFAFFGYRQRTVAFLFMAFSSCLFLISYYGFADQTNRHVNIFYVFNFFSAVSVSALVIYFIFRLNYHSEVQLTKKNDELMKANHELDRFVYSASHDLQAPLSSMLGLIEITQQAKDPKELELCLSMMKVRVNDLDQFVKEVIDYSRNSRQEISTENFNLLKLVTEIVEGLRFTQGFEGIRIQYEIGDHLYMISDRARIKIILSNLIGNAMKYQDNAKAEKKVVISALLKSADWYITIQDNGIGISSVHRDKIFNMFFRASEKSSGSGLGLYIVQETAIKLSGSVHVESEQGKGSLFTVTIPEKIPTQEKPI